MRRFWPLLIVLLALVAGIALGQLDYIKHVWAQISSRANRNLEGLTVTSGALDANLTRVGGAAVLAGNGPAGSGVIRTTIANNNDAIPTKTALIEAACKTLTINAQGVAGAAITVDATAGGITVMAASTTRCGGFVRLESGGDMRCATGALAPTTTVGFLVAIGEKVSFGPEGQQIMKCIRTGATSAVVSVVEETT